MADGAFCTRITLLFKRDLTTGGKEFIAAFSSLKAAKTYRKNNFHKEFMAGTERFDVMYPIERHMVKYQDELL